MNETISVSALNKYVKILLESDEALRQVWVEGEISGFKLYPSSGHMYFTLKDEKSSVRAVMFKTYAQRVRFVPKDGMRIAAPCSVSLYEKDGSFQLYVYDMFPLGEGSAQQQLDKLKDKLSAEGLFAAERKRALPKYPKKIAAVTSSSGAVIHDIISVLERRNPFTTLYLYPVTVQGANAVVSMKAALRAISNSDADLVIIARGGGSREDLWYFNDEGLVRAAASLKVPFISAVGHETDFTLLDYAADMRAPTPSAAAELAVPEIMPIFTHACENVAGIYDTVLINLSEAQKMIDFLGGDITNISADQFKTLENQITSRAELLKTLDPVNVLLRGYTITKKSDVYVGSVNEVACGDKLEIVFNDGTVDATAHKIRAQKGEQDEQ